MLSATQEEIDHVTEYMRSQARDLTVEFCKRSTPKMSCTCGTRFGTCTQTSPDGGSLLSR